MKQTSTRMVLVCFSSISIPSKRPSEADEPCSAKANWHGTSTAGMYAAQVITERDVLYIE